jgi:hypothetical protein
MSKVTGLSWGAVKGYYAKEGADGQLGAWNELPPIVEGTLALNTEKGDKREAPIEGGQNEFIAYKKSTYSAEWENRGAKEEAGLRQKPFDDVDGVVEGVYAFKFIPETPGAYGIYIKRAVVSLEDTFTSEDGLKWKYTADVLAPANASEKSIEQGAYTDPTASESESE